MTEAETEKKTSEHGNEAMEQNESEKEGEARAIEDSQPHNDEETSDILLLNFNERFEKAIKTTEGTIKRKVTGPKKK